MRRILVSLGSALFAISAPAGISAQLTPANESKVAAIAIDVLRQTGVPSASVGIVTGGKIVYTHAFGMARIEPALPATADMAYPIGSISKQFTATAVLLLQEQGKLSINDPVAKYFPDLTRAKDVTLRNLLTMTSGYEDFAPEDYSIPAWYKPTDPATTVKEWAGKPLDFEPGTKWQYSNTNFVLLGLIVEKVTGQPFDEFLREHVLDAAHLQGVFNPYTERAKLRTTGYISYALQPPRVLPLEAGGWYFAAAELAMPAQTLLEWDRTLINKSLLNAASYQQMETAFIAKDGKDTGYGLGMKVSVINRHLRLEHGGEVGGYVAENIVYPNDGVAFVVLTNQVASGAAVQIGAQLTAFLLPEAEPADAAPDSLAETLPEILKEFARGQIDRSLFTDSCNAYFGGDALHDFKSTLEPLGPVVSVYRTATEQRGGMTFGSYRVVFTSGTTLVMDSYTQTEGKIDQLLITARE